MEPDHIVLNGEEWDRAHRLIAAWKNDPSGSNWRVRDAGNRALHWLTSRRGPTQSGTP